MHALEWIAEHGRYLRQISAGQLRRKLGRERRTCTWCGGPVGKGRSTWCSKACIDEFLHRCSPASIRQHLERNRPLICAICGLDIGWLKKLRSRAEKAWYNQEYNRDRCHRTWQQINRRGRRNRRRTERWASLWSYHNCHRRLTRWLSDRGHEGLWEADHITPVIEGGGLCGPEGYRVLCCPCHRRETSLLAKRRSVQRRDARRVLLKTKDQPCHHGGQ